MTVIANNPNHRSTPTSTPSTVQKVKMTLEERRQRIAETAYFKAEKRGFAPDHKEQDWLEAEQAVEALADYWLP